MKTTLLLIRHGATAANLTKPYLLQGRGVDGSLASEGTRQAERTRHLLAELRIDQFFASPMRRATETARIIAMPHGGSVEPILALTECDVGRWEGKSRDVIEREDPVILASFMANPAMQGYPEGETFADVHARVAPALESILQRHAGQTVLVVGHHVVNRVYLAGILGLSPGQARRIKLDNCGISVVVREGDETHVAALNSTFHLHAAR